MNWDVGGRAASIAITAALAMLITSYNQWVTLVIGFGFAHYLLSFYYARAGIRTSLRNPLMFLPLVSLGALLAMVYFLQFPLEIYFGLHHACNEGYLRQNNSPVARNNARQLAATRALFHLAAYLCILRSDPMISRLPEPFLWSFLLLAIVLYLNQLRVTHPEANTGASWVLKQSGVELVVLLLLGLSFFTQITFLQVVMYHFVLWTIMPVRVMKHQGTGQLAEYGLLTVGTLLFFIVLITNQFFSNALNLSFYYSQFILWSYIHITTSFALSSAHPQWIVGLFREPAPITR